MNKIGRAMPLDLWDMLFVILFYLIVTKQEFSHWYFLVPIVGPIISAFIGGFLTGMKDGE